MAYYVVLIASSKAASVLGGVFNFETSFAEYESFMRHQTRVGKIHRDMYIKIFIDLTKKGFFKSDSMEDITSINNKVMIGIKDIASLLEKTGQLNEEVKRWTRRDINERSI